MPLASPTPAFRRRRFSNPLGLEPRLSISLGRVRFTDLFLRSPLSPLPSRIFLILVSRSPASTSRNSPLRLCLSRPSRSPSLGPSLSLSLPLRQLLSFFHHVLLPRSSPLTCPAFISPSPRLARSPVTRGETPSLLLIDPRFLLLIHT